MKKGLRSGRNLQQGKLFLIPPGGHSWAGHSGMSAAADHSKAECPGMPPESPLHDIFTRTRCVMGASPGMGFALARQAA